MKESFKSVFQFRTSYYRITLYMHVLLLKQMYIAKIKNKYIDNSIIYHLNAVFSAITFTQNLSNIVLPAFSSEIDKRHSL